MDLNSHAKDILDNIGMVGIVSLLAVIITGVLMIVAVATMNYYSNERANKELDKDIEYYKRLAIINKADFEADMQRSKDYAAEEISADSSNGLLGYNEVEEWSKELKTFRDSSYKTEFNELLVKFMSDGMLTNGQYHYLGNVYISAKEEESKANLIAVTSQ